MNDWRELVASADIDAVVIGTPDQLHKDVSIAALDAGKHVFTMNHVAASAEEARDMHRKSQENPHLIALVDPGVFYFREDPLMRALIAQGYVGQLLQVLCFWRTPYFGLGYQFESARGWFGEHARVFAHRNVFGVSSSADAVVAKPPHMSELDAWDEEGSLQANIVIADLMNGASITYSHCSLAAPEERRFEVYGTEGVLICYGLGKPREGIYGAKAGESELQPIPIAHDIQQAWSSPERGTTEAIFIAAVRGEEAPEIMPRFYDGMKLMEFAEGWRYSLDRGSWCDLPNP